jgi:hypothetical protein
MNAPRSAAERSFGLRRLSAIELLVAITVLLVSFPFIEGLAHGALIESILMTFVLVSAVLAIAGRRAMVITAAILAFPALVARWIHFYRPDLLPSNVFLIGGIVFVLFVIANLLRFVLTARSVDIEVLSVAISAYLLIGLLWTFAYWLAAEVTPGAFAFNVASAKDTTIFGVNGLYFSFVTLSTLGYGDITPVSGAARMLAAAESTTGLLYVAVLIARLVSLYSTPTQHEN